MFKTCPSCGDEFVPHVVECPDCRVPLEASDGAAPRPAPQRDAAGGTPAIGDAVVLRRDQPGELRQLAEALSAAGIACAIDTDPPGASIRGGVLGSRAASTGRAVELAVYVSAADAKAASAVQAQWLARSMPGSELGTGELLEGHCSGCNEPLPENVAECPSCGLAILPLEVGCPACGLAVAVEAESCPHCGHRP